MLFTSLQHGVSHTLCCSTVHGEIAPEGELFLEEFPLICTRKQNKPKPQRHFSLLCLLEQYTCKVGECTSPGGGISGQPGPATPGHHSVILLVSFVSSYVTH